MAEPRASIDSIGIPARKWVFDMQGRLVREYLVESQWGNVHIDVLP